MDTKSIDAERTGFSLAEIRQIWPQDLKRWRHGELIDALHRKVADIEQMDKRLRQSSGCAKARDSLTP
jgi:MerR, DNA binding